MRQIITTKELKSPSRDLPADLVLTVGEAIGTDVADKLVADGYAVEYTESAKPGAGQDKPKKKRGEG